MSTYFLNISNQALTKSTGKVFSRQFRVGDKYFGVSHDGIYEIGGGFDDHVEFKSIVKLADTTLGENPMKRLPEIRLDKTGQLDSAIIYDGTIAGKGVEQGQSGFVRFGKGGGGRLISLMFLINDDNLILRGMKLMPQIIGVGAL